MAQIVFEFDGGKSAIRPDGKDSTMLRARVVQFLMGRMKWRFQVPQAIKDAAARMTGNPPRMTKADMIAIQSDPQLLRSLKNAPADIQKGFLKTYPRHSSLLTIINYCAFASLR